MPSLKTFSCRRLQEKSARSSEMLLTTIAYCVVALLVIHSALQPHLPTAAYVRWL